MKASERQIAQGFLFTDLYQLTMAQLYFLEGIAEREAEFDYFFRNNPDYGGHQAGYCVFAGLSDLLDELEETALQGRDVDHLRRLRGRGGEPLFRPEFLDWLRSRGGLGDLELRSVPEGRIVHPGSPVVSVTGPLASLQLLETRLLNTLNYPTLVATKAARVRLAAGSAPVVDFGMRRGHGMAVNAGSRAALIGGVDASSNTGTSFIAGVDPVGTHGHSLVQAFIASGATELDAFRAYARAYPDNCLLLIDTVDTLASGLPNAIRVFEELRSRGHRPQGIRLDSGDLAHLAVVCASELEEAGFPDTTITLSNQLDEMTIWQVRTQVLEESRQRGIDGAAILDRLSYGVGTKLMVSEGAPSLDGVFKLVALQTEGEWQPAIKLSDSPAKTTNPGRKELFRVYDERGMATADLIALEGERPDADLPLHLVHPAEPEVERTLQPARISRIEQLRERMWADGRRLGARERIETPRERRRVDEEALDVGVRRLLNPHVYHVSLSLELAEMKQRLIRERHAELG